MTDEWTDDDAGFVRAMIDAWEFVDAKEVLAYYENRDKWAAQRQSWIDAGRPVPGDDGWPQWVADLQKMLSEQ